MGLLTFFCDILVTPKRGKQFTIVPNVYYTCMVSVTAQ